MSPNSSVYSSSFIIFLFFFSPNNGIDSFCGCFLLLSAIYCWLSFFLFWRYLPKYFICFKDKLFQFDLIWSEKKKKFLRYFFVWVFFLFGFGFFSFLFGGFSFSDCFIHERYIRTVTLEQKLVFFPLFLSCAIQMYLTCPYGKDQKHPCYIWLASHIISLIAWAKWITAMVLLTSVLKIKTKNY